MLTLTPTYFENRKLVDVVENRTVHTLESAELNIYETHKVAEHVSLTFSDPILVSMIRGKKVMNISSIPTFGFLPGESVALPSNETMDIGFPDASLHAPTQCLALAISKDKLQKTVDFLNQKSAKEDGREWDMVNINYRFTNDIAITQIIQRLIFIFTENHPSKDIFSEMLISELFIRILQSENRSNYDVRATSDTNANGFNYVVKYIKNNLGEELSVGLLSQLACMSESKFYKSFKNEFGVTPNEFIIEERLKVAENLLINPGVSVKEASLSSGFNSFSYFSRLFKNRKNLSPSEFKEKFGMGL